MVLQSITNYFFLFYPGCRARVQVREYALNCEVSIFFGIGTKYIL